MKKHFTDEQLIIIGLNIKGLLILSHKTREELRVATGVKKIGTIGRWINGKEMKPNRLIELAIIYSRWLGVKINEGDFLVEAFALDLSEIPLPQIKPAGRGKRPYLVQDTTNAPTATEDAGAVRGKSKSSVAEESD